MMIVITLLSFALALLGAAAAIGAFILIVSTLGQASLSASPLRPLRENKKELKLLLASIIAAFLGVALLLWMPAYYGGTQCESGAYAVTPTASPETGSPHPIDGTGVERSFFSAYIGTTIPTEKCAASWTTLVEQNGPTIIPLLVIPALLTFIPFAFMGSRIRPFIESLAALLLGGQLLFGMSYGSAFGPSGILMLMAASTAFRSRHAYRDPFSAHVDEANTARWGKR